MASGIATIAAAADAAHVVVTAVAIGALGMRLLLPFLLKLRQMRLPSVRALRLQMAPGFVNSDTAAALMLTQLAPVPPCCGCIPSLLLRRSQLLTMSYHLRRCYCWHLQSMLHIVVEVSYASTATQVGAMVCRGESNSCGLAGQVTLKKLMGSTHASSGRMGSSGHHMQEKQRWAWPQAEQQ